MIATLALLLLLFALVHRGPQLPWLSAAIVLVATSAALGLPDIDQSLPLGHRSALTHSAGPAALMMAQRRWWPLAAGIGFGAGLHLAADCFPNAMVGYATVKLPLAGSIGADASYAWLALNAVGAAAIGTLLVQRELAGMLARLVLAGVAATGAAYLFVTDGGWAALALLIAATWLVLRARRR